MERSGPQRRTIRLPTAPWHEPLVRADAVLLHANRFALVEHFTKGYEPGGAEENSKSKPKQFVAMEESEETNPPRRKGAGPRNFGVVAS